MWFAIVPPRFPPAARKQKLDLGLLRICKRINAESRLLPYMTNTFSIARPPIPQKLTPELLPDQISAFRALHFHDLLTCHKDAFAWDRAVHSSKLVPNPRYDEDYGLNAAKG